MRPALLLYACLLVAAPAAAQSQRLLPPEIEDTYLPAWIADHGEKPLWPVEARKGYRTRLRMSLAGISLTRVSIRIDERENGKIAGRILVERRGRSAEPVTERRFPVSRAQMDALLRRIAAAKLWTIYPEHWYSTDTESICVDGMELVMERADANGYRFSEANAQCTASPDMLEVAGMMIELSREPNIARLLQ